jgi:hypothetical protein
MLIKFLAFIKVRQRLLTTSNRQSLEAVESAIFFLSLDDVAPKVSLVLLISKWTTCTCLCAEKILVFNVPYDLRSWHNFAWTNLDGVISFANVEEQKMHWDKYNPIYIFIFFVAVIIIWEEYTKGYDIAIMWCPIKVQLPALMFLWFKEITV